jgi:membrane-associated phospholipid phosphatase
LFVIAVLIAIATVYGRYHYLADATCGAVIACTVPVFVPARRPNAPSLPQIALSTRRAGDNNDSASRHSPVFAAQTN